MVLDTVRYSMVDGAGETYNTTSTSWLSTMEFEITTLDAAATMMSVLVKNGYEVSFKAITKKKKTVYVVSVTQTGVNK